MIFARPGRGGIGERKQKDEMEICSYLHEYWAYGQGRGTVEIGVKFRLRWSKGGPNPSARSGATQGWPEMYRPYRHGYVRSIQSKIGIKSADIRNPSIRERLPNGPAKTRSPGCAPGAAASKQPIQSDTDGARPRRRSEYVPIHV